MLHPFLVFLAIRPRDHVRTGLHGGGGDGGDYDGCMQAYRNTLQSIRGGTEVLVVLAVVPIGLVLILGALHASLERQEPSTCIQAHVTLAATMLKQCW